MKQKHQNFRYLDKRYIKHPDKFLKAVVHQWGINWSASFNYLINSSVYPPMRRHGFDYGFMQVHLGQMLEVAFLILKKCRLEPCTDEELFQQRCEATFDAELENRIISPQNILRDIFGFKTLSEWHRVLEELLLSRDITAAKKDEMYFDLDYIPTRELLVKLPKALQEIYDRGGIRYCLPDNTYSHEDR